MDRRFAASDERMDGMEARLRSDLRADIADLHRSMIQWTVGTMIALTAAATVLATAIAHLT